MVAFLGLVILFAVSTGQASHIHGDWLPHSDTQVTSTISGQQVPGGEAGCPICVAMHSASPSQVATYRSDLSLMELRVAVFAEERRSSVWHFDLFSRPPPSL